jgi:hypothetical protein
VKQVEVREGARRQHRTIGAFAVLQCWIRNLDGLVIQRRDLERLIGLKRFKQARIEWMQEDLRPFFEFQEAFWSESPASFHSLFVSRSALESLPTGLMTTDRRLRRARASKLRINLLQMWEVPTAKQIRSAMEGVIPFFADQANFDERFLTAYLTLLVQGQISPHDLPRLKEGEPAEGAARS